MLVFGLVVVTLWICSFQTSLETRDVLLLTPHPPAGLGCPTCPIRPLLFVSFVVAVESNTRSARSATNRTGEATDRGCSCGAPTFTWSANHLSPPPACALLVCRASVRWSVGRLCPPAGWGSGCTFFIRILSCSLNRLFWPPAEQGPRFNWPCRALASC